MLRMVKKKKNWEKTGEGNRGMKEKERFPRKEIVLDGRRHEERRKS